MRKRTAIALVVMLSALGAAKAMNMKQGGVSELETHDHMITQSVTNEEFNIGISDTRYSVEDAFRRWDERYPREDIFD